MQAGVSLCDFIDLRIHYQNHVAKASMYIKLAWVATKLQSLRWQSSIYRILILVEKLSVSKWP